MNSIDWFYAKGGKHSGPVSSAELKRLATSGEIRPDDLVWCEGLAEWTMARNVSGLFKEENAAVGRAKPAVVEGEKDSAFPSQFADHPDATKSLSSNPLSDLELMKSLQSKPKQAKESHHLFDLMLELVRSQFSIAFIEATGKSFATIGKIGLFIGMGLILILALIVTIKTEQFSLLLGGMVSVGILAVLQYVGGRFCDANERLSQATRTEVSSVLFIDSISLLSMTAGLIALIFSISDAIAHVAYWLIIPGVAEFIVFQYLAFVTLYPTLINVHFVPETRPCDETVGLISFLAKSLLRTTPVVFGVGSIAGVGLLIYAGVQYAIGSNQEIAQVVDLPGVYSLFSSAAVPLAAFVAFLLISLIIGIWQAVLSLPGKLDRKTEENSKNS